jgi:2,4-dienoyl-CoA reductase (NADPH2)
MVTTEATWVLLLEPTTIGNLTLENRLVFLATHLGYCEDGIVSDRLVEFYRARAEHRPGLIIVGGCFTEHLGMSSPTMLGISKDEHVEGLSRLASQIHQYKVPVAAQLYHAGRYVHSIMIGEQAVSASEVACRLTRETPRALAEDEIHGTVKNFGKAARRAKKAGFDAVEIIGSAGYIINQFLAACTNKRTDGYGGNLKTRARFALEVVESVRAAVGSNYPVMYRISGEDFVEGGNTLEDNKSVVQWLEDAGVDCFNVTGGWHETRVPQITMNVPRGHFAYLAEGIAESVDVPVIACNRINSPTIAERILQRGKAQLIGMSRGFIADPELPEKIRTGHSRNIRTCIGCNACLDQVFTLQPVICAINPIAGFELKRSIGSRGSGKIAVIGAGPAGLETSRVLRLRGFDVTLFEEQAAPGGQLRLAAKIPGRGEFASYTTHMWREMRRLGVDLRLNTRVEASMLNDTKFDFIVCATGTVSGAPALEGVEMPHVMSAVDAIGLGCYTALRLSSTTESIHVFEKGRTLGKDLGRTSRWVIMKALHERCVELHKNAEVKQITHEYVVLAENIQKQLFSTDTVVLATEPYPRLRLVDKLRAKGIELETVGSVEKKMNLLETVHRAFQFASGLEL